MVGYWHRSAGVSAEGPRIPIGGKHSEAFSALGDLCGLGSSRDESSRTSLEIAEARHMAQGTGHAGNKKSWSCWRQKGKWLVIEGGIVLVSAHLGQGRLLMKRMDASSEKVVW